MQQFNLMNEQILIDENLPHNFLAEKMILSCLIANSDTIEMTLQILPIKLFILKIIKKFIKLLLRCMKVKS
jgi:replicative DNA helicase